MADVIALLQGRIGYLEQENAYLKDLLARWFKTFSTNYECKEGEINE